MKEYISGFLLLLCSGILAQSVCQHRGVTVENGRIVSSSAMKTMLSDDFSKDSGNWEIVNHQDRLRMERKTFLGKPALVITTMDSKMKKDTAFMITSKVFAVENPGQYALTFESSADFLTVGFRGHGERYRNRIMFMDANGIKLGENIFRFAAPDKAYGRTAVAGVCPKGTRSIVLSIGGDGPDFPPGCYLALTDVQFTVQDNIGKWEKQGEFVSGALPVQSSGGWFSRKPAISWKVSGPDASARFQIATAADEQGFPGNFSAFFGPDGTADTWFTHSGTALPKLNPSAKWVRYKAQLTASQKGPAILEQVEVCGSKDTGWLTAFDADAPRLTRTSKSPVTDGSLPLTVKVDDASGIDWASAEFMLDGKDARSRIFRTEEGFALRPEKAFSTGIHELKVKISDWNGNRTIRSLFFRIGKAADRNMVTLRDDGMTLVDGKPFFPLGIYSVTDHAFHGKNIDNTFEALKKAGINLVQTYRTRRDARFRKFMDSAAKHGMKIWIAGEGSSNDNDLTRIAKSLAMDMDNPALLAWYIADDTNVYNAPWQLRERTEMVKAIAPQLITVHADEVWDEKYGSKFRAFADTALAFMPEIYAVRELGQAEAESCVAKVIRDMEQCRTDIREQQLPPRSIWPIIQYFHGWGWQRFPTPLELRAMSFAALIHGGHGIIWYTYNSSGKNRGVTASAENWNIFTAVSREISSYAPVLSERNASRQLMPQICEGPEKNVFGFPSISALTKEHNGRTYLFCVNSVMKNVKAKFEVQGFRNCTAGPDGAAVNIDGGVLTADFAPYEVKIFVLK